jgi:hypothetical protein
MSISSNFRFFAPEIWECDKTSNRYSETIKVNKKEVLLSLTYNFLMHFLLLFVNQRYDVQQAEGIQGLTCFMLKILKTGK